METLLRGPEKYASIQDREERQNFKLLRISLFQIFSFVYSLQLSFFNMFSSQLITLQAGILLWETPLGPSLQHRRSTFLSFVSTKLRAPQKVIGLWRLQQTRLGITSFTSNQPARQTSTSNTILWFQWDVVEGKARCLFRTLSHVSIIIIIH